MGQVLIRNLDNAVIESLRARAAKRGLSLEAELRDVLTRSVGNRRSELLGQLAACRAMTPKRSGPLAEDLIREDRDSR